MKLLTLILLVSTILSFPSVQELLSEKSFPDVIKKLSTGSFFGYPSFEETSLVLKQLSTYPFMRVQTIGQTVEKLPIKVYSIGNKTAANSILFTGMHHGREIVSLLMNLHIILYLAWHHENHFYQISTLLSSVEIQFIPCLNLDAYKLNSDNYIRHQNLDHSYNRKNRKSYSSNCSRYIFNKRFAWRRSEP